LKILRKLLWKDGVFKVLVFKLQSADHEKYSYVEEKQMAYIT
jgi:hypothetical protein